jgi:hypothetical protein
MPNIRIESLNHTSKTVGSGKTYQGLQINGMQLVDQNNPEEKAWEKFVFEFDDAIKLFEGFEVGDEIKISNVRDGKYWKIVKVEYLKDAMSGGGGAPAAQPPAPTHPLGKGAPGAQTHVDGGQILHPVATIPVPSGGCSYPSDNIAALDAAVELMGHFLTANEKYKLFKATVTPDVLESTVVDTAGKFLKFLKEEASTALESDTKDLGPGKSSPEDDIPF